MFGRDGDEGADDAPRKPPLTPEEREALEAEVLPERAAMSTMHADVAVPIDPAIVADVLAGAEPPESSEVEPAEDGEDDGNESGDEAEVAPEPD